MLEKKIQNLIDKHQRKADEHHRMAEGFWADDKKELAKEWDMKSHSHESFALELRMILK